MPLKQTESGTSNSKLIITADSLCLAICRWNNTNMPRLQLLAHHDPICSTATGGVDIITLSHVLDHSEARWETFSASPPHSLIAQGRNLNPQEMASPSTTAETVSGMPERDIGQS